MREAEEGRIIELEKKLQEAERVKRQLEQLYVCKCVLYVHSHENRSDKLRRGAAKRRSCAAQKLISSISRSKSLSELDDDSCPT